MGPAGGCGGGGEPATGDDRLKIGIAYSPGGRGDRWLNDLAAAGLDRAKAQFGIAEGDVVELEADRAEPSGVGEERLRQLARNGHDPVIAIGPFYDETVANVAPEFPHVRFVIVDGNAGTGANVANLVFAENEGSFLVGAAAALKSRTGKIGFIGGVKLPRLTAFAAGYTAGAQAVRPDIHVDVDWIARDYRGFENPDAANRLAGTMYASGVDVIYHAAGASGAGIFTAAKQAGAMAIGVDTDQYHTADPQVRDTIITSMVKRLDLAMYELLKGAHAGTFTPSTTVYDLDTGAVTYSSSGGRIDDIVPRLEDLKAKVIAGDVTVPTS
ncbi:BMP family ABC transporter substrate-binding protein [Micromonospora sp. CPCC 205371]|nr:BMP family ABC transporter substrate-binding protein [Micromonospora sp. CPCC 205371]